MYDSMIVSIVTGFQRMNERLIMKLKIAQLEAELRGYQRVAEDIDRVLEVLAYQHTKPKIFEITPMGVKPCKTVSMT